MDPAVPWTAYAAASYNRLANAGSGFQAGEFQNSPLSSHQSAQAQSTTNQLILQAAHTTATLAGQLGQGTTFTPTSFLSPPSVGYDTVFSPLFHANPKSAAAHFRKQSGDSELTALHPQGSYFDHQSPTSGAAWTHQANSQLPSPFGILPHESVVGSSAGPTKSSTGSYENSFNPAEHFAAQSLNQLSSHLSECVKNKATPRNQPAAAYNSGQQSCIVSSASPTANKGEYRVPQTPARANTSYASQRSTTEKNSPRNFTSPPGKVTQHSPAPPTQQPSQQQTHGVTVKPQNKTERRATTEALENSQSSPISFALTYPSNPSAKAGQRTGNPTTQYVVNQNYRYNDGDYHGRKTGSADSAYSSGSNGPDCNAAVPRRPSPLQANSQASPLGHASSPAYPIYNSPSAVNQATPPSPLDVSVSRATPVAYPSVITRAEGRWEGDSRGNAQGGPSAQPRGKYPGYNVENAQNQRSAIPGDRQQVYFDAVQAAGDLSACRGDPMSIVKNLQNLHNCATIPPDIGKSEQERHTPKSSQKGRRKSGDKVPGLTLTDVAAAPEHITSSRVPPPAHLNPTAQQGQNGGYFEVERWNLTAPKMFAGHNQHQGLIAPHPHHAAPPIPYFSPFHLPPGHHPHPQEFAAAGYNENIHHPEPKEENPKVVVPNVEEELRYLSQQAHAEVVMASQQNGSAVTALPPPIRHPDKKPPNDPNSGFMASYLKFLQGERDTSPPPPARPARKTAYTRNKVYLPELKTASVTNNKGVTTGTPTIASATANATNATNATNTSSMPRLSSTLEKKGNEKPYNPDDDPRFYPLPKSTAKRKLDDSDSSEDEKDGRKTYAQMKTVTSAQLAQLSKGGQLESGMSAVKKQPGRPPGMAANKKKNNHNSTLSASDPLFVPPRRETSKRKAKEKTTIKGFLDKDGLDEEQEVDDPDFADSDTDPVWIPGAKGDSDDEGKNRKKKSKNLFGKPLGKRRVTDETIYSSDEDSTRGKKQHTSPRNQKPKESKETENTVETSPLPVPAESSEPDAIFNKKSKDRDKKEKDKSELTGEFVVMKTDLHEEYPPIWRIDGKTLLQKYEPFDENGKTLYRNISTYSGWTAQNRHIYVTVPVRFRVQSRMETIVELMRDQMTFEDPELMDRVMKDLEKYQDSFEVYIQTLISQALDSNFLSEILMEQDEYFLSNVKIIDDVTEDHCRRLLNVTRWRNNLISSFKIYPALNLIHELPKEQSNGRSCSGCDKTKVTMRIQVYGQPYNPTTLEGCQPDLNASSDKDFLLCGACGWRITLFSKATHQKYLMFMECVKRVTEKRTADPNKDTTIILNELLADETWLSQLFLEVRTSWAEIEKIEHLSCESSKQLLQNAVASAGIL